MFFPTNVACRMPEDVFRTRFLEAAANRGGTSFFTQFDYILDINNGFHSQGLVKALYLLDRCREVDEGAYKFIHKGDPFFWIATAAFQVYDYETAAFFYDAAVSQDVREGNRPGIEATPALKFVQLLPGHAAEELVEVLRIRIVDVLRKYNELTDHVGELTVDQLRQAFFRPAVSPGFENWRSLATTLQSFVLEWDYRKNLLAMRGGHGTSEPFFFHLFKGCVLFESLLKANRSRPTTATTIDSALDALWQTGLRLERKPSATNARNFSIVLSGLRQKDRSIVAAVELTGRIRNTLGHNLGWPDSLTPSEYETMFYAITASCLHAIACLYPATAAAQV